MSTILGLLSYNRIIFNALGALLSQHALTGLGLVEHFEDQPGIFDL